MDIEFFQITDVGNVRENNEDYAFYWIPEKRKDRKEKGYIFVLADGMGGYEGGEVASKIAVETVINEYKNLPAGITPEDFLREAIKKAHENIIEKKKEDKKLEKMGTTLEVVIVKKDNIYIGHIGDSRVYIHKNRKLTQITEDHSWVQEQVKAGVLTPEQAKKHPQKNLITKCLGIEEFNTPDILIQKFLPEDTILTCSDGLSDEVEDKEIEEILNKHKDIEEAGKELVKKAKEKGGKDNITIQLIRKKGEIMIRKVFIVVLLLIFFVLGIFVGYKLQQAKINDLKKQLENVKQQMELKEKQPKSKIFEETMFEKEKAEEGTQEETEIEKKGKTTTEKKKEIEEPAKKNKK